MHADQEKQLLRKLRVTLAEDSRGFTVESAGLSGVVILNKGHYRGVWHWADGNYSFTPGGGRHHARCRWTDRRPVLSAQANQ